MIEAGRKSAVWLSRLTTTYLQGVPAINVIADGRWLKGSHKHSYNTRSGEAVIIRSLTKKLLFMGV